MLSEFVGFIFYIYYNFFFKFVNEKLFFILLLGILDILLIYKAFNLFTNNPLTQRFNIITMSTQARQLQPSQLAFLST